MYPRAALYSGQRGKIRVELGSEYTDHPRNNCDSDECVDDFVYHKCIVIPYQNNTQARTGSYMTRS